MAGYSPWGCKELDTTEPTVTHKHWGGICRLVLLFSTYSNAKILYFLFIDDEIVDLLVPLFADREAGFNTS